MSRKSIVVVFVLLVTMAQMAFCVPVTFDRNLGATQSIIYIPGANVPASGSYVAGDSFVMPANAYGQWRIDTIVLYSVASAPTTGNLASEFSNLYLFTGDALVNGVAPTSPAATGVILPGSGGVNSNTNPNIRHAYTGISFLQEGVNFPIWATTFSNLNWNVPASEVLYVGMWGQGGLTNPGGTGTSQWGNWFNLYRSAGFADPLGADGLYEVFSGYNGDFGSLPFDNTGNTGFGDLNMRITAEAVPEPGTLSMLALGGVALMALRRRRGHK